jgi:hypothetical protein
MQRNVGPSERTARLLIASAAIAGAVATRGWPRTVFAILAAAGAGTALARYCPVNQAMGRNTAESPLDQGLRDTELRRHAAVRSALGTSPTTESGQPKVTPEGDVFGTTPPAPADRRS